MNARSIGKNSSNTDWQKLQQEDDSDIDYTDSPPTTNEFWENAKVVMPHHKVHLSVRFDDDIVEYFKRAGRGYQSRMNAVLRTYINYQKQQNKK